MRCLANGVGGLRMEDRNVNNDSQFPFTLGILASKSGIPKSTLREWVERYALIKPIGHSSGSKSYPLFNGHSARIAALIKNMRDQGFGISLIKKRFAEEGLEKLERDFGSSSGPTG